MKRASTWTTGDGPMTSQQERMLGRHAFMNGIDLPFVPFGEEYWRPTKAQASRLIDMVLAGRQPSEQLLSGMREHAFEAQENQTALDRGEMVDPSLSTTADAPASAAQLDYLRNLGSTGPNGRRMTNAAAYLEITRLRNLSSMLV